MRDIFNFDKFFNSINSEFNQPFSLIDSMLNKNYEKSTKKIEIPGGTCVVVSYTLIPKGNDELNNLKTQLSNAVENQEFEKAAELRDKIKEIEKNKTEIDNLTKELDMAVKDQNFEKAAKIRDQIKTLKN
jgi:excinuclease UvrABC helicase subunit UvrB